MENKPQPKPAAVESMRVAAGKSVTSLRGVQGPGKKVDASVFPGGQATVQELQEKGVLVTEKQYQDSLPKKPAPKKPVDEKQSAQ